MDYEMDCYPHGFCIIFNNSSGSKPRPGTGKDRCKLKELFKYLKYEVITEENKSADEMFNILTQINQDPKNQTFDSFVCCFLSHGDGNSIHGCDGKSSLPYTTIWSVFGKECSTLRNKPKIFIIQSCQTAATARLTIADQEMGTKKMDVDSNLTDSMETHDGEVPNIKFDQGLGTDHADILFIHASVPGKLFHMSSSHSFGKLWQIFLLCREHDISFCRLCHGNVCPGFAYEVRNCTHAPLHMPKILETCKEKDALFD